MSFLFLHAWLCTYGFVAGVLIILGQITKQNLWNAVFATADGTQVKSSYWILLQYMMQTEQAFISVTILCLAVAIMLHCFYIYHFWLIKSGLTTNEAAKSSSLKSYLNKAAAFYERWLSKVDKNGDWIEKPSKQSCEYYGCRGDESK